MPSTKIAAKILSARPAGASRGRAGSVIGEVERKTGVLLTPDVERIARLPRRSWKDLLVDDFVSILSRHCARPGSHGRLFDVQAAALIEFHDYKGFLGNIGLGDGKSLITFLAPTLIGAERPVLLAPGKLRDKTARDIKAYRKDWLVHPKIEFISYEQVSRDPDLLASINTDCLMGDEVHKLKNLRAGCTKRVAREKKRNPYLPFMGLSGTMTNRELAEFWHLMMWTLLPERMPLPRSHHELKNWHLAIDEKVDEDSRIAPGVLLDIFAKDIVAPDNCQERPEVVRARLGVRRRFEETAGYIMTTKISCEASISLEIVRPPRSAILDQEIRHMRETKEDINGEGLLRPADIWAKARMYACGFRYRWKPPPPTEWRIARRNKDRLVRWALESYSASLDTPFQVENAIRAGKITKPFDIADEGQKAELVAPFDILMRWQQIAPLYKHTIEAEWLDLNRINWIAKAAFGDGKERICWVEHIATGQMLHEITGLPFYHEGGYAANKAFIDDARGPIIASVGSNYEGRNLQHYSRNFIVSAEPVGKTWEQLLGRTHRTHQLADEVEVQVLEACPEHAEGFQQVLKDCEYVLQTQGVPQRMLMADLINP